MSGADIEAREPPNLPIGVRTAERIYTSVKKVPPNFLV
jgi:hypothetical protein